MRLKEEEFRKLHFLGSWETEGGSLIAARYGSSFVLGKKVKGVDGMACTPFPNEPLLIKAFTSVVMRQSEAPEGADVPDLFSSQVTLDEATEAFKKTLNSEGQAQCPCCEDMARIYRRKLPTSGLMALYVMVQKNVRLKDGKMRIPRRGRLECGVQPHEA
jgi:hypothetical protein